MSEHTKEPWQYSYAGHHDLYISNSNTAPPICRIFSDFGGIAEANARRIVACVNACAGYSTEDLEQFGRFISTAENVIPLLEQKCDDLLAALRELLEMQEEPPERNCSCHISPPCNDCVDYSGIREATRMAKAAIAAAEGDK